MATKKSTRAPRGASVKQSAAPAETSPHVDVPFLSQRYRKAPDVDPYLKPGSVTEEVLNFGDITWPPIRRGLQATRGFDGATSEYPVRVIWISRREIDWALREIVRQRPELETVMEVVSKWMCRLDTIRSEMKFSVSCALSTLRAEEPDLALAINALEGVREAAGSWHDEYRLGLR